MGTNSRSGGWFRSRRRVLDDQVVALPAVDGAADHLDVPADAVLLVDDEVAGLQLHQVDGVAPAGRHLGGVAHAWCRADR